MRKLNPFLMAAALLACTSLRLPAANPPVLNQNLAPLKPLLGEGSMSSVDQNGQVTNGKASVRSDVAGNVVTLRNELLDSDGKVLFTRLSILFWQPESKSIAEVNFDSNGWRGTNVLTRQTGDKLAWQGSDVSADGKAGSSSAEIIIVDSNTWTAQFLHQVYGGQAVPDSPKFKFTRKK